MIVKVFSTPKVLFFRKKKQRIFQHTEYGHVHFRFGLDLPMKGVDKIIESFTREFKYLKQGQLLIGS
jgi:hypothetical protein